MKSLPVLLSFFLQTCSGKNPGESSSDNKIISSKLMLDERVWTTENLNIEISGSYCQQDEALNCNQYGRLYTWEAAKSVCKQLGDEWRLPTNEEWQTMAKMYGGIYSESNDDGKLAYSSLLEGGSSEFHAFLGVNRETTGSYERFGAHGFYWTATEHDTAQAWFYNFAKGRTLLNRHTGDKNRALSVRCIREKED